MEVHLEGYCLLKYERNGYIEVRLTYDAMDLVVKYLYGVRIDSDNIDILNETLKFARNEGMNHLEGLIKDQVRLVTEIRKYRSDFPKHVQQSRLFKLRNKAFNTLNQELLNKRTRESLEEQEIAHKQVAQEQARQSLLDQGRRIAQDLEQSRRDAEIRRQMMLNAISKRQEDEK